MSYAMYVLNTDLDINKGLIIKPYIVTTNHTLTHLSSEYMISVNTQNAITITLPNDMEDGRTYVINSLVENPNITIDGNGKNILDSSTMIIDSSYNSVQLIYNSTKNMWFII